LTVADKLSETIKEKAENLSDLKYKFETLVQRAEDSKKKGVNISLPEFEAFGWERFEEFIGRLEDSINTPLLEEARKILDGIVIVVNQPILDRLKSGLYVRREDLIEILQEMSKELKRIQIAKLRSKAKQEMAEYLREGRWDDLLPIVGEWQKLQGRIMPITKEMDKKTFLYNAVFDKALEEGPSTQVIEKLMRIENRALQIGGEHLKERIKFEKAGSQINPLSNVDEDLGKIAKKKEEIRLIKGGDIDLGEFIEKGASLKKIIKRLESKYGEVEKNFNEEYRQTEKLLRKYNNLATILKKNSRSMPTESNLRQLKEMKEELSKDIKRLETELRESLTQDAREFIDYLLDGRLPEKWEANRVVKVLHEIINSGYTFEIKRVE